MRMFTTLLVFLLAVASTIAQFWMAPGQSRSTIAQDDSARLENALLWKVEGEGLAGPSYVFGTIHLIPADDFFLPGGTEAALAAADRIVFEIDLAEMMDLGAQLSLFTRAIMPGGQKLSDLLSEEDYQLVSDRFAELGLPMMLFDRIKPMFLSVFASSDMSPDGLAMGTSTSYEMEFYELAKSEGIPTGGLETMEFQMSVFDSIPYEAQAEMLVETIRAMDTEEDQFDMLIGLYKKQDIETLYTYIGAEEGELGPYEDLLVGNRNERWISGMRDLMKEESVFFAVGAGHLGGEKGVIRLLRAEGYAVSPVLVDSERPVKKL